MTTGMRALHNMRESPGFRINVKKKKKKGKKSYGRCYVTVMLSLLIEGE